MKISSIKVGALGCNCYVLTKNNQALIIDPGEEEDRIIDLVKDNKVIGILVTHHHFDHVGALDTIRSKYNVKVYDKSCFLEYNKIGDFKFKMIETSGHTSDSVTYYFEEEKVMFTGDFLFKNSIGRTDLDTGNMLDMQKSIDKILTYPEDITIYPGHGESTTLKEEFKNNYFLRKE